jgi:capsid protein
MIRATHRRRGEPTLVDAFDEARLDYKASKRSGRFQRRRRGVPAGGASGDWHMRSEGDFLWAGEMARELYRNDCVIGQLVDRAVASTIGSGLTPDPQTPDKSLNKDIKDRLTEELVDPDFCDTAGELTFHEIEEMTCREMFVPGDVFALPTDTEVSPHGTVELRESHRCRSPSRTKKNIVQGVELDPSTRQRLRFWFTNEPIDPNSATSIKVGDLTPVPARDEAGEALVWHLAHPKRPTQTRGFTPLNPIIDVAGMHDDVQFAQVVKAQLAAFFLLLENRDKSFFETNPDEPRTGTPDPYERNLDNLRPGSRLRSPYGAKLEGFTPNIPNPEFFPHVKLILTLLGINLGLPLCVVLLDAAETNFSGWRGAIDQARIGFRGNQRRLRARLHRPFYRFKINTWADADPILATQRKKLGEKFLAHGWNLPGYPYIQPEIEAMADLVRLAHTLISPRRWAAERGFDWNELVAETVQDRTLAVRAALAEAQTINGEYGLEGAQAVSWRDICPLPLPERVTVSLSAGGANSEKANDDAKRDDQRRDATANPAR